MKNVTYILTAILSIIVLTLLAATFVALCRPLNEAFNEVSAEQCSDANGTYTMGQGCISSDGLRILNPVNLSGSQKSQRG